MKGSEYHKNQTIFSPPAKRHLAFRWQADDGPATLNAGLVAL